MTSKVVPMQDAIGELVRDGDTVAIEGFTHLISFAAGHEIIRQRRKDLTLCRMTPDLVYDQMIAAGVASKLVFSWLGNPGVGSLHAIRRAVEGGTLEVEEYSHHGMVSRYQAGAARLPFLPLWSYEGSDLPRVNPAIRKVKSPYGDEEIYAVPPLRPDVTVVAVQRADAEGNGQVWGILGSQREAAFAAERVILVCEELVEPEIVRADPNRTLIPGLIVDAVVAEPRGCHPSYAQGYYDRDNPFYREWDQVARDRERLGEWLRDWVHGVSGRAEYAEKLGENRWASLRPGERLSGEVNYGEYA